MPTLPVNPPKAQPPAKPNVAVTTRPHLWTASVKILGNLIPAAVASPFAIYGIWWMAASGQVGAKGFWIFAMSPLVGWLAMNYFGLHKNELLKAEVMNRIVATRPDIKATLCFVGVATPKYASLLDPHEDVGYLILHPDRIEFFGDHLNLSIAKHEISGVDYRANPHSILGLGRWISVEGIIGDSRIRFEIEPRERKTLLGNLVFSRRVRARI